MLQKLSIQNFILIKELGIDPDAGMNVITGETGAGKSILLGAIGLLMGQRADSKTLYNENEKCIIEGQFLLSNNQLKAIFDENDLDYDNPCIVRREISVAGKSRAFVNDTPVNLDQLDAIVGELMDVHSQHETILLKKQNYQIQLLDDFAQNSILKTQFQTDFQAFKKAEKQYQELLSGAKASAQELDYIRFVVNELDDANFQEGEQDKLEEEQTLLDHATEIKEKLAVASTLLDGEELSILSAIQSLSAIFDHLSTFSPEYRIHKEKLTSIRFELRDLNREIETFAEKTGINPARLAEVQERLSLIYKLQRKHGVSSISELLTIQEEFSNKLDLISNSDEAVENAKQHLHTAENKMKSSGLSLTQSRNYTIPTFEKLASEKLALLGMPNATFQIQITDSAPTIEGLNKIQFMFSANKGLAPKPMADVASGGEFSRLMLVIKYLLAGKKQMPTIIFDEIDSGVSGEVANNMAELIEEMASRHQVFTISHLPQMASKGNSHFFVYKDESEQRTVSHIRKLSHEERIQEIAKMIGGKTPSESALQSAKELLGNS
jgi:DNA repair protein RecN (Recombination protein N)